MKKHTINRCLVGSSILLSFLSCNPNSMTVNGTIEGCPNTKIYVYDKEKALDSTMIKDEKFEFYNINCNIASIQIYVRDEKLFSPVTIYPDFGTCTVNIDYKNSTPFKTKFSIYNNSNHLAYNKWEEVMQKHCKGTYNEVATEKINITKIFIANATNEALKLDVVRRIVGFIDYRQLDSININQLDAFCLELDDGILNSLHQSKKKIQ